VDRIGLNACFGLGGSAGGFRHWWQQLHGTTDTADGKKELIAVTDGYRQSEQSWTSLLLGLKQRGLTIQPKPAIADGALGFWAACRKLWPNTREQRCWVHKTANVLDKPPDQVYSPKEYCSIDPDI